MGKNNIKAYNTNCWREFREREFIYCLWDNKLVQLLLRAILRKAKKIYSIVIKLLGIPFRPREIIVPLAKEDYTKMSFPNYLKQGEMDKKPKAHKLGMDD